MGDTSGPIVVGYLDSPEGRAALEHALVEAHRRATTLVVVHSTIDEDDDSGVPAEGSLKALIAEAPVEVEFREVKGGRDVSAALLAVV